MLFTAPSPEAELAAVIPAPVLALILPLLQASFPIPPDLLPPEQFRQALLHLFAAYNPENAAEAMLAAQLVMLQGHIADSLRRAAQRDGCQGLARQHRVVATRLTRTLQSGLTALARMQTRRQKQEQAEAARTGYGPVRHFVPAEAQENEPVVGSTPCTVRPDDERDEASTPGRGDAARGGEVPNDAPPPEAAENPVPSGEPAAASGCPSEKPPGYPAWADMTEAERYAILYPDRAVLIRDHGGVPDGVRFGPPSAELAHEVVRGRGPVFDELDSLAEEMRAKTAYNVNRGDSPRAGEDTVGEALGEDAPRRRAAAVNLPSHNPTQTDDPAVAEAERFIALHPDEAALIRAFHGVPPWPDFTAPASPAVVRALILGRGPAFDALDRVAQNATKTHAT